MKIEKNSLLSEKNLATKTLKHINLQVFKLTINSVREKELLSSISGNDIKSGTGQQKQSLCLFYPCSSILKE